MIISGLVCAIPGSIGFYFEAYFLLIISLMAMFAVWGILAVLEIL